MTVRTVEILLSPAELRDAAWDTAGCVQRVLPLHPLACRLKVGTEVVREAAFGWISGAPAFPIPTSEQLEKEEGDPKVALISPI